MTRTAFVTGGTGFVGLNLIQKLMAEGWDVTALHRSSSDLTYLNRFAPKLVVGEITDPASLLAALPQGTDTVFHVAGDTNMWRKNNAAQTRNNVEGTRNVVEACIAKGVRRLIVTSSISAYGPVSGVITEKTPSLASTSWVNYEKTKWVAQQVALAAVPRGLEVVVLQPGAIMGAYDIGTWSRMFLMVRDGKLPAVPLAGLSFAHVREVVNAHIAAADRGENGGCYLLAGEEARMLDLVREISVLVNKPAPTREAPAFVVRAIAAIGDFISTFTGVEPSVTPEIAAGLGGERSVDSTKARTELGFKLVPLKEMVKDCYDWMKAEGRL